MVWNESKWNEREWNERTWNEMKRHEMRGNIMKRNEMKFKFNERIEMNALRWMNWNEWLEINDMTVSCAFSLPHLPKLLRTWHFLHVSCEIELSLQSHAHFVDPLFQKCSEHDSFWTCFTFFDLKSSSRYSFVHILLTSSSKVPRPWQFFLHFLIWNWGFATVLCTCCRQLSPIEPRNRGNRDPPSATTPPEKIQDFAPESVFKREFTHSRPNADVVVDMMMWL